MPECSAGECGISCPGPCGCGGSGSRCSCACFPPTVATKSHGDAAAPLPGPVASGGGLAAGRPFDTDFKGAPLVALASFLVPDDLRRDVCIPAAAVGAVVTRADRGIGLTDLLRSLGLRGGRNGA